MAAIRQTIPSATRTPSAGPDQVPCRKRRRIRYLFQKHSILRRSLGELRSGSYENQRARCGHLPGETGLPSCANRPRDGPDFAYAVVLPISAGSLVSTLIIVAVADEENHRFWGMSAATCCASCVKDRSESSVRGWSRLGPPSARPRLLRESLSVRRDPACHSKGSGWNTPGDAAGALGGVSSRTLPSGTTDSDVKPAARTSVAGCSAEMGDSMAGATAGSTVGSAVGTAGSTSGAEDGSTGSADLGSGSPIGATIGSGVKMSGSAPPLPSSCKECKELLLPGVAAGSGKG